MTVWSDFAHHFNQTNQDQWSRLALAVKIYSLATQGQLCLANQGTFLGHTYHCSQTRSSQCWSCTRQLAGILCLSSHMAKMAAWMAWMGKHSRHSTWKKIRSPKCLDAFHLCSPVLAAPVGRIVSSMATQRKLSQTRQSQDD